MRTTQITASVFLSALLFGASCTRVPEIDEKITPDLKSAAYPDLIPLNGEFEPHATPSEESEKLEASLKARSAAAQRRADALRAAGSAQTNN